MSMTFGAGITLGAGMSVTPSTDVGLRYDPAYIGDGLGTWLNDTAIYTGMGGEYVALTQKQMTSTGKFMATIIQVFNSDPYDEVGVATRSVNLNTYLGGNTNGIGYTQDGTVYYDDSAIASGLDAWGLNDVIDVAVDNLHNRIWFRVNNGFWNNDDVADPSTNTNGIDLQGLTGAFFAVGINSYTGPSEVDIQLRSVYDVPAGFTFWAPTPSITITSSDFSIGGAINVDTTPQGTNGVDGFINNQSQSWLGEGYYGAVLTTDAITRISTYLESLGIDPTNNRGYVYIATWGDQSDPAVSGLVKFGFYNGLGDASSSYFDIQTIDTSYSGWETPNSTDGYSLPGTFMFPLTITAYLPLINKSGWC